MEKPAVSLADVTFSYRGAGAPSLSSLSLDVAAGECVLLCGKSGCGKSTVLRLLNGMIPEFYDGEASGRVEVAGMDPASCPQYEIARSVGTVFQNPRTQFFPLIPRARWPSVARIKDWSAQRLFEESATRQKSWE